MSKKLEEYISAHKKDFDANTPSDQLWSKISQKLDQEQLKKPYRVPFWLGIAASLIVLMTVIFIYTYPKNHSEVDVASINPGYAKKELRFACLIEEKKDSLQIYAANNPALYQEFSGDLEKLDADYEKLKKELANSPNQRLVVKAMARNLELQLQVINQQLSIINEVNQIKEENKI